MMLLDLSKGFWPTLADYLSSYGGECVIAALIVAAMAVLIYRAAIRQEMEENPWKYRKDDGKDNSQLPTDEC